MAVPTANVTSQARTFCLHRPLQAIAAPAEHERASDVRELDRHLDGGLFECPSFKFIDNRKPSVSAEWLEVVLAVGCTQAAVADLMVLVTGLARIVQGRGNRNA